MLGVGHSQLLIDLVTRFDAIVSGDVTVPRAIVLEGPSGIGKSRIIRELYRALQARQSAPAYWPPLPEGIFPETGRGAGADPMPDRKRLGPPLNGFVWPGGARPGFSWWEFSCERMRQGDLLDVVSQARPALEAHYLPVRLAWHDAAGWPARLRAQRPQIIARAKEAATTSGMETAEAILDAAGVVVPGLDLALIWVTLGFKAYRQRLSEMSALQTNVRLGGEAAYQQTSDAAQLATKLRQVAHPKVPALVVVEDIHLLGPDLVKFLTVMSQRDPDRPVMVIGTAWPEGRHNPNYDRWLRGTGAAGNLELRQMPALQTHDLVRLVRRFAPAIDDRTAILVAKRYPNPLALKLFLSLKDTQDQIQHAGGRLIITDTNLDQLPREIFNLYWLRWQELPELTRTVLSYTAGTLPPNQPTFPFSIELVANAIASTDPSVVCAVHTAAQKLREAGDQYGWIASDTTGMCWFREGLLTEVAENELSRRERAAATESIRIQLVAAIDDRRRDHYWLPLNDQTLNHSCIWLIALLPLDHEAATVTEAVAVVHTARMHAASHEPDTAARLFADPRLGILDPAHPDTVTIHNEHATCLLELGQVQIAIAKLDALVAHAEQVLGPNHVNTLRSRNSLALAYESSGDLTLAISLHEQTLTDTEQIFGSDHPNTLTSMSNLAHACESAGKLKRAIALNEKALDDRNRILGHDHPDTLASMNSLAGTYQSTGAYADAISLYEQTLSAREKLLGEQHFDAIQSRNDLASAYLVKGDYAKAISLNEKSLAVAERILGADHPNTLTARSNLAVAHLSLNHLEQATPLLEQTVVDMERILGPDHPDTLTSRNSLAAAYRAAGDTHRAIPLLKQTLDARTRILGPDNPSTLQSRNNLGHAYQSAGEFSLAISLLEKTVSDVERVLGSDHPDTLTSRNNLAAAYLSDGQFNHAVPLYEQTLADRKRILGSDHPDTLQSLNSLATAYLGDGQLKQAVPLYEQTLADRKRILGPDSHKTIESQENLAFAYQMAGEAERAIPLYEQALAGRTRVFGADHPDAKMALNRLELTLELSIRAVTGGLREPSSES
ncbi:hypothetical protein MLP_01000 [Microlunatus phosphovorus NM-1]|uniref:Uncharacterized protein n=1 Tax=Microlunatus phosphovorus (strain ATCC 700054 / DSM 10555 / JCM 9379 / NBRC 101784 / NCIMB 13414 / VKM Ac-1990 / NM-1) TaxID=1032480 RepID=F5XGK7_MICPN|nr:hypothetical protein MLP_01000 [Microlunatus phosphovorus NM-1]